MARGAGDAGEIRRALPQHAKRFFAAGAEIVTGIRVLPLPGHTPGLAGLLFASEDGMVAVAGDSVMTRDFFKDRRGYYNSADFAASARSIDLLMEKADIVVPGHGNYFLSTGARCRPDFSAKTKQRGGVSMSSETVNRKRRRKRRSRRRSRSRAWIAVLAVVLVAAAGAGAWIYFRGLPPKAELYLALRQWTGSGAPATAARWRRGSASARRGRMRRARRRTTSPARRRSGARPWSPTPPCWTSRLRRRRRTALVLLPQTEVAFSLPDRVEAGAAVTFVITGPDMAQILPQLDGAASPEALREELRAVLAQGDYPERTVTAQAPIEALESGYRLRNSYALIDGLYGGLPGIVAEALPAAQETGREEA